MLAELSDLCHQLELSALGRRASRIHGEFDYCRDIDRKDAQYRFTRHLALSNMHFHPYHAPRSGHGSVVVNIVYKALPSTDGLDLIRAYQSLFRDQSEPEDTQDTN